MTESWRQLMDIGLVHFMAYPVIRDDNPDLVIASVKAVAQDDFFDVIEVRRSSHEGLHAQIKGICDQAGMKIGVGAQPGLLINKLSLNNLDEASRQAAIDEVKAAIDASYEMGARICACLPRPGAGSHRFSLFPPAGPRCPRPSATRRPPPVKPLRLSRLFGRSSKCFANRSTGLGSARCLPRESLPRLSRLFGRSSE